MNSTSKKHPELLRSNLLIQALRIIQASGLQGLTLDAVAREAGVSKGGLLHHFPSKQALIDAMVEQVFTLIDIGIEDALAKDTVAKGRFTRAYLSLLKQPEPRYPEVLIHQDEHQKLANSGNEMDYLYSIPLTTLMFDDEACRIRWHDWLARQLERHQATDNFENARLVRFAADGIWLSGLLEYDPMSKQDYQALIERLMAMTY